MIGTCRRASELSSKRLDEPLGFGERLMVWGHHAFCVICKRFASQIEFISRLFKIETVLAEAGPGLKPEAKERLKQAVSTKCQFTE